MSGLLSSNAEQALSLIKENNRLVRKRNRLAKRQYRQSVLDFEQAERQYLIEKAHLQPSFRIKVTEFLTCEPDAMADPEQAVEAKYLSEHGIAVDELVLRLKIDVKGDAEYMRPYLVLTTPSETDVDERAHSMTEFVYFATIERLGGSEIARTFLLYLVYRDKTTLPVVHKYCVSQLKGSTLQRWEVEHIDTAYARSHKNLARFNHSQGCEALFDDRDEAL